MESRNAKSRLIKNWIDAGRQGGAAAARRATPRASSGSKADRHVQPTATLRELADQFVRVLASCNGEQIGAPDWKVEIAVPDRAAALYIVSASHELSLELASGPDGAGSVRVDARLSIPYEDLRRLTNFETDFAAVMTRNRRIDAPDKPLVRPLSDLLFAAYNLHHLDAAFRGTPIEALYRAGKVSSPSGTQRFIYPWAISADIGNVLYRLVRSQRIERTLEIGLA